LDELIAKVREYRWLAVDWDTYGGKPASERAVDFAASLLTCLHSDPEISAPFVSPISNGVYLEWKLGHMHLYFEVDQTSVLIVARDGEQIVHSAEDANFDIESALESIKKFHEIAR
jgi:hypothetical protein